MNKKSLVFASAALTLGSSPLLAQDAITSELDASIRLGLTLDSEPDTSVAFRNRGSRLRWNGTADIPDSNTTIISYLEFGFDQGDDDGLNEGVNQTRQGWVGAEGDFGTVKGGKQYRAFYDAVSSITDTAWWNSCFFAVGCTRTSSVVKYSNDMLAEGGDLMASMTLEPDDIDDDVLDQLDLGGRFAVGDNMSVGAAISIGNETVESSDAEADADAGDLVEQDTGLALGVGVTTTIDDMDIGAILEYESDDYIGGEDDGFLVEGSVWKGNNYVVAGLLDSDNSPYFVTLGHQMPLIEDRALMYFEAGVNDTDEEGSDLNVSARAIMVFHFDVISTEIAQ